MFKYVGSKNYLSNAFNYKEFYKIFSILPRSRKLFQEFKEKYKNNDFKSDLEKAIVLFYLFEYFVNDISKYFATEKKNNKYRKKIFEKFIRNYLFLIILKKSFSFIITKLFSIF